MNRLDVAHRRMQTGGLVGSSFARPQDAVEWLVAVQAQDYGGAKWALAQRTRRCTDEHVEQAFQRGEILRTHVMRPTWHFVMPADVRWMLGLTAARVHAANAYYYRKLELDAATFRRSEKALAKALQGGKHLTRVELTRVLENGGIRAGGLRLGYLMMHAELEAVICSGPRLGKQFTYSLLDERVAAAKTLRREEALVELTRRYFSSHGPALLKDYVWWSGLTVADAKLGIELAKSLLAQEVVDGQRYWFAPSGKRARVKAPTIHLLPNYDEYLIAYKDHGSSFDPAVAAALGPRDNMLANHIVVMNGEVIGGWRRTIEKNGVTVATTLLVRLDEAQRDALEAAVERYGRFLGVPARLMVSQRRSRGTLPWTASRRVG